MAITFELINNTLRVDFNVHWRRNPLPKLYTIIVNIIKMISKTLKLIQKIQKSSPYKAYKQFRANLEDQKQNRELIGQDRFGNKYYQYYSYLGLPIRRQIRFKNQLDLNMRDLVYYRWLHHQIYDPPTQIQKQQYYLQEKVRFEKALEWDNKQKLQALQYRKKREELLLRDEALKQIEDEMKKNGQLLDIKTKRQN